MLDTGLPFIRSFRPAEYRAQPVNWTLLQDRRGFLLVGNGDGVLEYDGVRWSLVRTTLGANVRGLAQDAEGRVWVAATAEVGSLEPDTDAREPSQSGGDPGERASGGRAQRPLDRASTRRFVSRNDRIEPSGAPLRDARDVLATSRGLFVVTRDRLVRVQDDQVRSWRARTSFARGFLAGDRLLVKERERGLLELVDGELKLVPGGERFASEGVTAVVPLPQAWRGSADASSPPLLIGTERQGLFRLDGDGIAPFASDAQAAFRANGVAAAAFLTDGTLAVGTRRGGVVLLDPRGRTVAILDRHAGLASDVVLDVLPDRQSGLWVATDNGLSRVEWPSPFSYFDARSGLEAGVLAAAWSRGELCVGTTQGVQWLAPPDPRRAPGSRRSLRPVEGIAGQSWVVLPAERGFLVASATGLYEVERGAARLVRPSALSTLSLCRSRRDPSRLFVGLADGLASLRASTEGSRSWSDEGLVPGISESVASLVEDASGALWLATYASGVLRVTFGPEPERTAHVERFGTQHGLPGVSASPVFLLEGTPRFATRQGVYRLEPADRFALDPVFRKLFPAGPRYVVPVHPDAAGRVLMETLDEARAVHETGVAVPSAGGGYRWETVPLVRLESTLWSISTDADGVAWLGGPDGLVRYDPRIPKDLVPGCAAFVRRALRGADRVLLPGPAPQPGRDAGSVPALEHGDEHLRFDFAAPCFDGFDSNRFQVRLDGHDRDWSRWSAEAFKEYTNLHEGTYTLRLKARDVYGVVREGESVTFVVLPPWYRTGWAYLGYALLLVGQGFVLVRWRSHRLLQEKRELEARVAERTRELTEAQERIARLMEGSPDLLADLPAWATAMATRIQETVGAEDLGVYEVRHGALEVVRPSAAPDPPPLADVREALRGSGHLRGALLVPARGLAGDLLGLLEVRGLRAESDAPRGQLLNAFASQLGAALETVQLRRKLLLAEEQKVTSLEELHARGIDTLSVCPRCGRCSGHAARTCDRDGTALEVPGVLPLKVVDRYRFTLRLGEGGMGTVYEAHDEKLDRTVAIKLMRPGLFHDATARLRFEREARTIAQVSHPGVVTVYDCGELPGGSLYLIMERLSGLDLGTLLRRHGPGTPRQVAQLLRQASSALDAAHRRQIVHRDVKPQNLFLTPEPAGGLAVKVLDFGLAKSARSDLHLTLSGYMVGTPSYMAPEQLLGQEADVRSDLFSFATVVYEVLTGEPTVTHDSLPDIIQSILHDAPPPPSGLLPGLPPGVDAAFAEALAKEPRQRPASIVAWAAGLAALLEGCKASVAGWPAALPADQVGPAGGRGVHATEPQDGPPGGPSTRSGEGVTRIVPEGRARG